MSLPRARTPRHAARGFTLVEVMVAMTIMAVLAGLAWRGVDGMVRARDGSQAVIERTMRLNTVLVQWEQDLQAVQDTGALPALAFDGGALRLTRAGPGGVQLVVWSLDNGGSWRRWVSPVHTRVGPLQQSWLASQQLLGLDAQQVRLLDDVAEWQVYFYRRNAWTNAQSTADAAEPPAEAASGAAARDALPGAVRLVVKLPAGTLTRDIALGPQP